MTEHDIEDYLQDVLETIQSCGRFIEGMYYDQFTSDENNFCCESCA
jgi:uncharacterized protein with HEPN domain